MIEILFGDQRDGNVIDVDLVLLDQMQEQIERPLVLIQTDPVGVFKRVHPDFQTFGHKASTSN